MVLFLILPNSKKNILIFFFNFEIVGFSLFQFQKQFLQIWLTHGQLLHHRQGMCG